MPIASIRLRSASRPALRDQELVGLRTLLFGQLFIDGIVQGGGQHEIADDDPLEIDQTGRGGRRGAHTVEGAGLEFGNFHAIKIMRPELADDCALRR